MGAIYIIKVAGVSDSPSTGYIGQDWASTPGYYPRAFEHVLSGYHVTTDKQPADRFIGKFGAFRCEFYAYDEKDFYGLDEADYNTFSSIWTSESGRQNKEHKLNWAEISWIYSYRHTYSTENEEWGGQRRLYFNTKELINKLKNKKASPSFRNSIEEVLKKNPLTWSAKGSNKGSFDNIEKLFHPEVSIIQELFNQNAIINDFSAKNLRDVLIKSLSQKTAIKLAENSSEVITPEIQEYLEDLFIKKYGDDFKALQNSLNYSITWSLNPEAVAEIAKQIKITVGIKDTSFTLSVARTTISLTKPLVKVSIPTADQNKNPSWLKRGYLRKSALITDYVKNSTVSYAWKILSEEVKTVPGADVLSIQEKVPFVTTLTSTQLTELNDHIHDKDGKIINLSQMKAFADTRTMFKENVGKDNVIYIRRNAWSPEAKAAISYERWAAIELLDEAGIKGWNVW